MKLQKQLTLSHLLVTIISIVIVVVGLLVGNWLYLKSSWAAKWTADWAEIYAEDMPFYLETSLCPACLDSWIEDNFLPADDMPKYSEWIIIIDPEGTILASNYTTQFPQGKSIWEQLPFGIDASDFISNKTIFGQQDNRHFALTTIQTGGWVYYHSGSEDVSFQLQQTARIALWVSVALGIIALILSGIMGSWLGRFFGRKLTTLGAISTAFAAGDLNERIPVKGNDEISQLGQQFNAMADTIAQQIVELRELAETNAQLAEEVEGLARLEERNRLARDLHDAIKQQLFGLNLTLGSIPALFDSKPQIAKDRLQQVILQTQAIQVELDQIIKQMRPASLQDHGLATAVRQLTMQWSQQTGVATTVNIQHERDLPLPIEQAMYRIVQEALQNVGKHAQATQLHMTLQYELETLHLHLADNGLGFDINQVDKTQSFGLQNMWQRATKSGGTFKIESGAGGTQLTVTLPTTI